MPILNIQLAAQDPSGNQIPPLVALQQRGPVVQVSVSVEQNIAQQLLSQGLSLPTPERGFALILIDTGATSTCIDDAAAARLNLPAIDVVTVASASHASTQQNVHPRKGSSSSLVAMFCSTALSSTTARRAASPCRCSLGGKPSNNRLRSGSTPAAQPERSTRQYDELQQVGVDFEDAAQVAASDAKQGSDPGADTSKATVS